jgi:CRISPR/Cas system-associated exonuclease Cas4 (RecB family)
VSALQRFANCPYQFLLSAIHRLEPRKQIAPLEQMDPLTRGHLFHRVQADLVRDLRRRACLPVTDRCLATAFKRLDAVLDRVAEEYRDELVPAIDRVWADEVEAIRADLRGWLHRVADEGGEWTPLHTEFGFGFAPGEGRDPDSRPQPVTLDGKWRLHGVVDLIEERSAGVPATGSAIAGAGLEPRLGSPEGPHQRALRVTDHKTGKPRAPQGVIVGGGEHLQPVLYGAAVEQALGRRVDASRLFYCTAVGRFEERRVQLGATERRHGFEVLEIVDRAIEQGVLVPAPRERVCDWCDFREVCGPWERQRSTRKPAGPLKDLEALRTLP